jgi:Protein of unknown function (DUF4235)
MGASEKLLWKLYVGVIGVVTTVVAQRLVTTSWKVVTGDKPPSPTDPDVPTSSAVTWALASGLGVGVTQLLVKRSAARRWATRIGQHTPPGGKVKLKVK